MNSRFPTVVLYSVLTVAFSLALCAQADARGTIIGLDDPRSAVKDPFKGNYEVRGEGFVHNVGNLWVNVTNLGVIGNPWKALSTDPSGQYPPGSGVEYLYASGIWVGAKIGTDPNPYVSTALYQTEFRPSTLPIDTIYESYEGYPGGTRFFNDDGDSDPIFGLEYVDEEIHDGKDNDDDGAIDEDFAAISQQMFTCVYRDDTQEALNTFAEHVPMGLEVVQKSFAWGIPGSDNFVGFEFTIKNDGRQDLFDLYLGFLCDGDAGPESEEAYWRDDRAGLVQIDTTVGQSSGGCSERLRLDVGFTRDADGDGGRAEGWFGVMFLGHTTDPKGEKAPPTVGFTSFRFVSGGAAFEKCGDPGNDLQRYTLLSSGEIGCRPGQYEAPDDADYRIFFGTGPFSELRRGESLTLQVAFVVGIGRQGMIENAVSAQRIYNGAYEDQDENPETGVDGKETCLTKLPGEELPDELDPFKVLEWCDFPDSLKAILGELPEFRPVPITEPTCEGSAIVQYVDLDCDPCTGIDGKEKAVRWRGASTPPCPQVMLEFPADEEYPCNELKLDEDGFLTKSAIKGPSVRLSPRDEAVVIQWNNAAELVADPLSGVFDFAGYRIWKAEQWERPEGSTGPTPELWSLLAEYRLPRFQDPKAGHKNLDLIRNKTLTPCDTVDAAQGLVLYPVGYYQHRDDRVLNGFTYFYAVTAFDLNQTDERDPITDELEVFTLECRHVASEDQAVIPGSSAIDEAGKVFVVPNPYYGSAAWDLVPNPRDPTGTHVDFMNMPTGDWTLKIYTVAGDLVRILENDGSSDIGQVKWDLVSRNGQDVVSGLYLFTVESGFGTQVGKFVVLRD